MTNMVSLFMALSPYLIGFFTNVPIEAVVRNVSNQDIEIKIKNFRLFTFNPRFVIALFLCLLLAVALNIKDIANVGLLDAKGQIAFFWALIFSQSQFSFYTIWKNSGIRQSWQPALQTAAEAK